METTLAVTVLFCMIVLSHIMAVFDLLYWAYTRSELTITEVTVYVILIAVAYTLVAKTTMVVPFMTACGWVVYKSIQSVQDKLVRLEDKRWE